MNIAFVPARCGSKSIPFKNIKKFCGKPLVYWNLQALQKSTKVDKVVVATDCEEIQGVVNDFGLSKVEVFQRNKENASDEASSESVMLEYIQQTNYKDADLFLLVQATSPLTQTEDFNKAIEKYIGDDSDSLFSCIRTKNFFWDNNGKPINYDYLNRPRRQDNDGILMENGAFYINNINNIKREKNRLSGKISTYEMEPYTAVEIDDDIDWLIAEQLMYKYVLSKKNGLYGINI